MVEHILNMEELAKLNDVEEGRIVYVEDIDSYRQFKNGEWTETDALAPDMTVSLYDLNKSMFRNQRNMDWRKVEGVIKKWNPNGEYFLIYGKEIGYFTLLKRDSNATEKMYEVFKDCLINLGDLKACDITEEGDALEIWVKPKDNDDVTCLYLFNYDGGVVKFNG